MIIGYFQNTIISLAKFTIKQTVFVECCRPNPYAKMEMNVASFRERRP